MNSTMIATLARAQWAMHNNATTGAARARFREQAEENAMSAGYAAWPDRAAPRVLRAVPELLAAFNFGLDCRDEYEADQIASRRFGMLAKIDAFSNPAHADF
jgi:hypothetical protein